MRHGIRLKLPVFLWLDLRLALRNILRQRRRSMIAVGAIAFGVIAMMLSSGYVEWIHWANRELIAVTQIGHIQITRPGYHEEGRADPMRFLLPPLDSKKQTLESTPSLRAVVERLTFSGLASHTDSTISFLGEGIDADRDPSSRHLAVLAGETLSNTDPKGIQIGSGLAANLGVQTGDTVVLLANTASGGIHAVEVRVRGIVATSMKAYDDSLLRVTLETARELLRTEGAHIWVVSLDETSKTSAAAAYLRASPELRDFDIVPWSQLADFHNKTVELFSRQMGIVKLIIAVIIVLSITNTMTMSVMERTIEIGTAMALGLRRRRILVLFLLEGGLLGALGGACGIAIGQLAAQLVSTIGIPMPPAPGMSRGFVAGIIVTGGITTQAAILALSTTLLASVYPAWRASRLVIVDALRHNR